MSRPEELPRVNARTAREVLLRFELDDEVRARVRPDWSPSEYLNRLLEKQNYTAAVQFLAHALPKREAVWWACLCAKSSSGTAPSAGALAAAEKWVANPTEESRRQTVSAALAAGLVSPAGCAALAAFVAEGSLGAPEAPPIPPAETMTSQTVAGGVLLAAAQGGEGRMAQQLRACLALGLDVARGKSSWADKR